MSNIIETSFGTLISPERMAMEVLQILKKLVRFIIFQSK